MGFHFRKSVRIAPGVRLNLSKSGVSTTLGGRGLSMNVGKRGTYVNAGIPGTGVSSRTRIGGTVAGTSGSGQGTGPAAAGCLGCGAFGFLFLLLVGFCSSLDTGGSGASSAYEPLYTADSTYSAPEPRETFYMHGALNVRTGPGKEHGIVRTLSRGERVQLGPKDARGWAAMYDSYGQLVGYVYRASNDVRSYAPRPRATTTRPRRSTPDHPAGASAICRDGTYSYSANRRGTCSWHGGVAQWLY